MGTVCRTYLTATATLFLFFTTVHLQEVKTSGIFELNLVFFENREGRVYQGSGCCSGRPSANGLCPPCPVYLRICVKHYQVSVDPASPCTFHEFITPMLKPRLPNGTITSDRVQVLDDQQNMSFDLNFTWPGQFTLIVEAWHTSERNSNSKTLVARFTAQRTLKYGLDWAQDEMSNNHSSVKVMYRVYCSANYYGPSCGNLCKPRDDKFGHYTCRDDGQKVCNPGWSGIYCEKAVCLSGCHQEHGTCEYPNECKCRSGWEGQFCDTCIRYPGCMHGTCTKRYECNCEEGWGGLFCDQDLNYCTNHKPCQNGGTCTNTGQGYYTCSCTEEFMGSNCDILHNPCQRNPCKNGGACKNPSAGEYICECASGYFGPHCETSANVCTDNPCENGGLCVHDPSGFICDCPPGFMGVLCEKTDLSGCRPGYCSNGGICIELQSGPHCNCPQGLSGDHCEILVTCSSNVCKNGGTCHQQPISGLFTCTCAPGFSGWYCEEQFKKCASNPCANGGVCRDLPEGYRCDCKIGYSGKNCTLRHGSNPCNSDPCKNGATCHDTGSDFYCHCLSGYHGNRCQHKNNSFTHSNRQSSIATNVSHRISSTQESQSLSGGQVALIASLSSLLPIFVIVLCCGVCCTLRRRKRQQHMAESPAKSKECDFDVGEEQLQNERNAMHMNNKHMPQKIVNTLDRLPAKVSNNEAPPKVLNVEVSNKKVLDKSLVCSQRTLQKKDNIGGSSVSSPLSSAEWLPSNSTGSIYVIEDHFRLCPETKQPTLELEKVLATEV